MRILVFGAGAMGSLLGAFLAGRHEVTLIGRQAHIDAVRNGGLRVEGLRAMTVQPEAKTAVDGSELPDLVIVAVKAYQTAAAIPLLGPAVTPKTTLLTVQNGLGNYEALRDAFPKHVVLGATVTYGAMLAGPGRVLYAGQGEILAGGSPTQLDHAGRLGRLLRDVGLRALGVPEIRGPIWQKAIVNAAINPLTALTGRTNGELLTDPELQERMRRVVEECSAVARALKIALPDRDVYPVVLRIARATADNRSSMLQDITNGRRTEIDAINGVFATEGKRLGIPTPENEALVRAVHQREGR